MNDKVYILYIYNMSRKVFSSITIFVANEQLKEFSVLHLSTLAVVTVVWFVFYLTYISQTPYFYINNTSTTYCMSFAWRLFLKNWRFPVSDLIMSCFMVWKKKSLW